VGFHIRDKDIFCPSGITECDRYFRVTEWQVAQCRAVDTAREPVCAESARLDVRHHDLHGIVVANGHALADPNRTKIMYLLMGRHDMIRTNPRVIVCRDVKTTTAPSP
jgi:hypothetical protein